MPPHLPAPINRIGLNLFRRLPPPIRRRVVGAGTPNFTVGALLLLRDGDDRILLVRQRHTNGWSLPGGLLESGETPEAALVREVGEELTMTLDPGWLTPAVPHALVDPQSRRVDIVFTLTSGAGIGAGVKGDVKADGVEVLKAHWFAPAGLPRCARGTYRVLTRCGVVPTS